MEKHALTQIDKVGLVRFRLYQGTDVQAQFLQHHLINDAATVHQLLEKPVFFNRFEILISDKHLTRTFGIGLYLVHILVF